MVMFKFSSSLLLFICSEVTVRFPQNLTVLESDGEISFSLFIAEQYDAEICITLQAKILTGVLDGNVVAATGEFIHGYLLNKLCITSIWSFILILCVLFVHVWGEYMCVGVIISFCTSIN